MSPKIKLENGKTLVYSREIPSEGYSSILWDEIDSNGRATGIGGDIIMSDDNMFKTPFRKLVMDDYQAKLRESS